MACERFIAFLNRPRDFFGRIECREEERPEVLAAIQECGVDHVVVSHSYGGGDDSYQLEGRNEIATFIFPWQFSGSRLSSGVRRDIVALQPESEIKNRDSDDDWDLDDPDVVVRACETCGEIRPCIHANNPFVDEGIIDSDDDPLWWCYECYRRVADDI